jgi:hypothetical protein
MWRHQRSVNFNRNRALEQSDRNNQPVLSLKIGQDSGNAS